MIEMYVTGIALDAARRTPIVLLKDVTGRRALPIWIGQTEARAIMTAIGTDSSPRPMTHDLTADILKGMGVKVTQAIIHALKDDTFFAVLTVKRGKVTQSLDSRPSDAIALALRMDAPILVMEEVIADASIPVDHAADEEEREAFREFLENIRPEDFSQSMEER